jgi:hypothetical protein
MNFQFEGIREKLVRTDQNICNLQAEVSRFFQECEQPVLPKMNDERHAEAVTYHKTLRIPVRFSVLSGEIIHHLRSCLDHLVWNFSSVSYRESRDGKHIEFPILKTRPLPKDKFTAIKRKIKGVTDCRALKTIYSLQPYRVAEPAKHPLWMIHDLDITDKHRELVIISGEGRAETTSRELAVEFAEYVRGKRGRFTAEFKQEFDKYGKVTPQIAFRDLGWGESKPVIPLLQQLTNTVRDIVGFLEAT